MVKFVGMIYVVTFIAVFGGYALHSILSMDKEEQKYAIFVVWPIFLAISIISILLGLSLGIFEP